LNQEFHATSEKRVLRGVFDLAHRVPGHDAIARRVPNVVKEKTFRHRTRGIDPSLAVISADIRLRLADTLRDDVHSLRAHLDDGFDGWGIG
jgi:hypothetical protein